MSDPVAVLFDIDGTLISTGGAGAEAWRRAFEDLHHVTANIEDVTEAGMPDQEVVAVTFRHVLGREATARELAALLAKYLEHLPETVVCRRKRVVDLERRTKLALRLVKAVESHE